MDRCSVCNGRTLKVDDRYKCMNSQCEGSTLEAPPEGVICRCGEVMSYQGEDLWGQPNYVCLTCKMVKRI